MTESYIREAIVTETLSWVGTMYHLGACIKGVGADCATLIYGIMRNVGIFEEQEIGIFSHDWFCHTSEEKYLQRVLRHAYKLTEGTTYRSLEAKPGCICLFRTPSSKVYNHGAIVIKWPMIVHAIMPAVQQVNAVTHPMTTHQHVSVYDPALAYLEKLSLLDSIHNVR